MPMLNQENNKSRLKIKKSHICLFGSLLVIFGISILSYNHIEKLKKEVFSKIQLSFIENNNIEEVIDNIPNVEELKNDDVEQPKTTETTTDQPKKEIDYSKYLGVLEIPRISLKRGFYGTDSKYNNISYNVTVVGGSTMPDVNYGNLILMAHSGDAYISYFAFLYKLSIGNDAYVTYGSNKYRYKLVNIYNVPKNGTITISRNISKTTLTLITCTKNSDTEQTVYIFEMV